MKNARAVLGFAGLSDSDLESTALSIIDHMTDNANFPTPVPSMTDVTAAVTEYTSALAGAKSRDKAQVELKNIKRQAMISLLTSLAAYVSFTANGNRNIIATSGFSISKNSRSPQTMGAPTKFKISAGKTSGEASSSVGGVKGRKMYVHQYTPDPLTEASVWTSVYLSTRNHTFTGLDSAKKYWFRVAAIGTGGQTEYTDPVALIIQ